ncbi:hypothetical protein UL82_07680 [Corynebacterium kutscheri]|uniref:Uncharacterized protein n=1 Tax=Corynebacterium kutscheri TaxID=35755 RepID=A0A0F6R0E7_9CORY|nr:hypothetical protein [Corynebacterium kutscheri]AKE41697.1 hypothetical protein UL82_07680 [Corynebacterium kutscheri]VEH10024.1 putative secreted protein [Corynebacterium kutscheri]
MPKTYVATALLVSTFVLGGCAEYEPARDIIHDQHSVVTVLVSSDSSEQLVLGELYSQALNRRGRESQIRMMAAEHNPVSILRSKAGDLYIACSGDILSLVYPEKAQEIEKEMRSDSQSNPNDPTWREETYAAVMGALGETLDATDPSNALGCADSSSALPQNILPIYRIPVLSREERLVLNEISGTISTSDLSELVVETKERNSARKVVAEYLDSKGI